MSIFVIVSISAAVILPTLAAVVIYMSKMGNRKKTYIIVYKDITLQDITDLQHPKSFVVKGDSKGRKYLVKLGKGKLPGMVARTWYFLPEVGKGTKANIGQYVEFFYDNRRSLLEPEKPISILVEDA